MGITEILIEFLKEKAKLIDAFLGIKTYYILKEDYCQISKWPLEHHIQAIRDLSNCNLQNFSDSAICPWCSIHLRKTRNCDYCQYGKYHGDCANPSSKYQTLSTEISDRHLLNRSKIETNIGSALISVPGMKALVCRYNAICVHTIRTINRVVV